MAIFLYYGEFAHYGYCENWIAAALDRNGHNCLRISRAKWFDPERLIQIIETNRVQILLISKAPEIAPSDLELVRRRTNVRIIWWTFDWMRHPENWAWYKPLAQVSDLCFQTDGTDEEGFYASHNIARIELHQGCVPQLHDVPRESNIYLGSANGLEVVFIGSNYTDRRHRLMAELSQYDFQKWGEPAKQVWGNQFAQACYFSKIVIGDNFVNDVPGYWSDRVYLALACGAFFLTAYVPGIEKVFRNEWNLVWYHDFDEMHELIRRFLPMEAVRRSIALNGYRLVHAQHTYDRRIQAISHEIERRLQW
jgi:hypothetical protein